jgi:CTP:molybdopterin cytidylyltransferase MocA
VSKRPMSPALRAAAVILAAGESRRLGRPKQLLPVHGEPLLRRVAAEVCGSLCSDVGVVVGEQASAVSACVAGLPVTVIVNPDWREGMASSIRHGVSWASGEACEGVVLVACDQPALMCSHVDRLVERWRSGPRIVASRYAGSLGVPAVFSRELFVSLLSLRGRGGAKSLIAAEDNVAWVDWPEGELDIDTPADAARLAMTSPRFLGSGSGGTPFRIR